MAVQFLVGQILEVVIVWLALGVVLLRATDWASRMGDQLAAGALHDLIQLPDDVVRQRRRLVRPQDFPHRAPGPIDAAGRARAVAHGGHPDRAFADLLHGVHLAQENPIPGDHLPHDVQRQGRIVDDDPAEQMLHQADDLIVDHRDLEAAGHHTLGAADAGQDVDAGQRGRERIDQALVGELRIEPGRARAEAERIARQAQAMGELRGDAPAMPISGPPQDEMAVRGSTGLMREQ